MCRLRLGLPAVEGVAVAVSTAVASGTALSAGPVQPTVVPRKEPSSWVPASPRLTRVRRVAAVVPIGRTPRSLWNCSLWAPRRLVKLLIVVGASRLVKQPSGMGVWRL